jgi:hypothetical protein
MRSVNLKVEAERKKRHCNKYCKERDIVTFTYGMQGRETRE